MRVITKYLLLGTPAGDAGGVGEAVAAPDDDAALAWPGAAARVPDGGALTRSVLVEGQRVLLRLRLLYVCVKTGSFSSSSPFSSEVDFYIESKFSAIIKRAT